MEHTRIPQLPTRLNVEAAWEAYSGLVKEALSNPRLLADLHHVTATARAYGRWQSLFLKMDAAA